jgi:hypothetical protein
MKSYVDICGEKKVLGGEGAPQVGEIFDQWDLCFDRCGLASKDTFLTKKQSEDERGMGEGWTLLTKSGERDWPFAD